MIVLLMVAATTAIQWPAPPLPPPPLHIDRVFDCKATAADGKSVAAFTMAITGSDTSADLKFIPQPVSAWPKAAFTLDKVPAGITPVSAREKVYWGAKQVEIAGVKWNVGFNLPLNDKSSYPVMAQFAESSKVDMATAIDPDISKVPCTPSPSPDATQTAK